MATKRQSQSHKVGSLAASNASLRSQEPPPPPSMTASQAMVTGSQAGVAGASGLAASAVASGVFSVIPAPVSNASVHSALPPPHMSKSASVAASQVGSSLEKVGSKASGVQVHSAPGASNTSMYPKHPAHSHASMTGGGGGSAIAGGGGGPGGDAPEFHEADYLKQAIGPPLIAALADVCIKRPADPIEYLSHWLVHWKFNRELRKHDVKTALELMQQKEWEKYKEILQFTSSGFTPQNPYGPIGYGGPEFGADDDDEDGGDHCGEGPAGNDEVEQLYRNSHLNQQEVAGEYGPPPPYHYNDGEESDRPVSYYSEPPPTSSTAIIEAIEQSSGYSGVHTTESQPRGSARQPRGGPSSRSVMSSREVQHRRDTRTRNESLPDPNKVPDQYRRPSEEPQPQPLSAAGTKSQLSTSSGRPRKN